jgi:hypothetical protein
MDRYPESIIITHAETRDEHSTTIANEYESGVNTVIRLIEFLCYWLFSRLAEDPRQSNIAALYQMLPRQQRLSP